MTRRITVSGLPGSGTSTLCRRLSERTGLEHVNAGRIFRDLAGELGLSLVELGRRAEADGEIDRRLDERMTERARAGGCVLEGRVTGWMMHRRRLAALRVWVEAELDTRARRVAGRDRQPIAEATAAIVERERSERQRYSVHYRIDLSDLSIYDLVVDSGRSDAEALCGRVEAMMEAMTKGRA